MQMSSPQKLITSHRLQLPSPLVYEGGPSNNEPIYQYPPTRVPEFSEPELGSCDELHDFSCLPQEDDQEILILDGDDFFTLDGEFLVYQENRPRGNG